MRVFAKLALSVGSGLTVFAVVGAAAVQHPVFELYYYFGAVGLTLIIVGCVSFIE